MKKYALAMNLVVMSFVMLLSVKAHADSNELNGTFVEIPIDGFISPQQGFEDKNIVEGVVYGNLPNACYSLAKTKVTRNTDDSNTIDIKQYAVRRKDGLCADDLRGDDEATQHLKMRIPFSTDVFVGNLTAGSYTIQYRNSGGMSTRTIEVAQSVSPGDSLPYANVMNAMTTEVVDHEQDVTIAISGVYNSSCTTLARVENKKIGDVFVLLPILKTNPGVYCTQVLIPFQTTVNLGKAEVGNHLVHIRSMNGKAVNRLVQVIK